ncbi:MAG: PhzF family phenazine biosynthesis protein [Acidobacteriota bacterium]
MKIPLYQVDAFHGKLFAGNPAAVCPLESWLPDNLLQSIAAENNLAETAYFVSEGGQYRIRWFTPTQEVDLCGHATLASAFVLCNLLDRSRKSVTFDSRSGPLEVRKEGDRFRLDFPTREPSPCAGADQWAEALGARPEQLLAARDLMAVFETEQQVRGLAPDMNAVARLDHFAVIVTAPGQTCDFVSRFFAPGAGVPEDHATGSAHCTLTPYWSRRLGKKQLHALQVSPRGAEFFCEDRGDRTWISGRGALYLEGMIHLD